MLLHVREHGVVMGNLWLAATAGNLLLILSGFAPPGRKIRLAGGVPSHTCVGVGADLVLSRCAGSVEPSQDQPVLLHTGLRSPDLALPWVFLPLPSSGAVPCSEPWALPVP